MPYANREDRLNYQRTRKAIDSAYYHRHKDRISIRRKAYKHKYARTVDGRYGMGKNGAKARGLEWTISKEEYAELIELKCVYCGFELPEAGAGLDRLDNNIGYTLQNVVPCCDLCNTARSNNFSFDEMKILGNIIRQIRLNRI